MTTPQSVTGLILAGGKSTRFGSDKASAVLAGRPLLEWVVDGIAPACGRIVVVRAAGQRLPPASSPLPLTIVEDLYEAKGPLAGLVAGFAAAPESLVIAVSCDVPLVRPELVTGLATLSEGYDIVLPHVDGYPQPLLALYRAPSCLPVFRQAVEHDRLKITAAYHGLRVRVVREAEIVAFDPALESFRNLNRAEDLDEVSRLLAARHAGG